LAYVVFDAFGVDLGLLGGDAEAKEKV